MSCDYSHGQAAEATAQAGVPTLQTMTAGALPGLLHYVCGQCGHKFYPRSQSKGEPTRCPECGTLAPPAPASGTNGGIAVGPIPATIFAPPSDGDDQPGQADGDALAAMLGFPRPVGRRDEAAPIAGDEAVATATEQAQAETVYDTASAALAAAGVSPRDAYLVAVSQLWQHIPRCGGCGRFLPTQDPVCVNPRCQLQGREQGEPVAWPPAGYVFKASRVKRPARSRAVYDRQGELLATGVSPALVAADEYDAGAPVVTPPVVEPAAAPMPVEAAPAAPSAIQPRKPGQVSDAYYIARRDEKGRPAFTQVDGESVTIPGFEAFDLFVHPSPGDKGGYTLTEARTGMALGTAADRDAVIAATQARLGQFGQAQMQRLIDDQARKGIRSPRYVDEAPAQIDPLAYYADHPDATGDELAAKGLERCPVCGAFKTAGFACQNPRHAEAQTAAAPFKAGDRVTLPNGRHGVIDEVHAVTIGGIFGGAVETRYGYHVKTDNGARLYAEGMQAETEPPARVVTDPEVDTGVFEEPDALYRNIQYKRRRAQLSGQSAARARKKGNRARHEAEARTLDAQADVLEAVWNEWARDAANGSPDEAAAIVGQHTAAAKPATAQPVSEGEEATAGVYRATVRQNEERDGVEISFAARPPAEVIQRLHAGGYRWSGRQKLWYAKCTERTLALAGEIAGASEASPVAAVEAAETVELYRCANCGHEFDRRAKGLRCPECGTAASAAQAPDGPRPPVLVPPQARAAYGGRHVDTLGKKAKTHRVSPLGEDKFEVVSGASGKAYRVRVLGDGQGATCTCDWGANRPSYDQRSGCSHVMAVVSRLAGERGEAVKPIRAEDMPIAVQTHGEASVASVLIDVGDGVAFAKGADTPEPPAAQVPSSPVVDGKPMKSAALKRSIAQARKESARLKESAKRRKSSAKRRADLKEAKRLEKLANGRQAILDDWEKSQAAAAPEAAATTTALPADATAAATAEPMAEAAWLAAETPTAEAAEAGRDHAPQAQGRVGEVESVTAGTPVAEAAEAGRDHAPVAQGRVGEAMPEAGAADAGETKIIEIYKCANCGHEFDPRAKGLRCPECGTEAAAAEAATPPTADIRRVTLEEFVREAAGQSPSLPPGARPRSVRTREAKGLAETAWSQIGGMVKMRIGAARPTVYLNPDPKGMDGLEFAANPVVEDHGLKVIKLDYDPRRPKYKIRVLYDAGADTYVVQRIRMKGRSETVEQEKDDVYFDDLDDVLERMCGDESAGPMGTDVGEAPEAAVESWRGAAEPAAETAEPKAAEALAATAEAVSTNAAEMPAVTVAPITAETPPVTAAPGLDELMRDVEAAELTEEVMADDAVIRGLPETPAAPQEPASQRRSPKRQSAAAAETPPVTATPPDDLQAAWGALSDDERAEKGVTKCAACGNFVTADGATGHKPGCAALTGEAAVSTHAAETPAAAAPDDGGANGGSPVLVEVAASPAAPAPGPSPLAAKPGQDYAITDADAIGKGGAKQKFRDNLAAIKLLKQIETEGRAATPDEQAVLVKYTGWGGIPQAFDDRQGDWSKADGSGWRGRPKPEWRDEYHELKALLTGEKFDAERFEDDWDYRREWLRKKSPEYQSALATTPNAHYTSPLVVKAMWEAVKQMGFRGGAVLEPAAGIGHFFGLMPPDLAQASARVGVELDSVTGRIAKALYPNADMHVKGFETTKFADNTFDLAISNVPFGNYPIADVKMKRRGKHLTSAIHNYFFAKGLDQVKPGGMVAFITSRFTLDAQDPALREYLASQADLVGAIRLPNTAFRENAGTEVTTDILFLRKRAPGDPPADSSWTQTVPITVKDEDGDDVELPISKYFVDNPDMLLGRMEATGSMYGADEGTLADDGRDLARALDDAITRLPADAIQTNQERCHCGAFMAADGTCNNPNCSSRRVAEAYAPAVSTNVGTDGLREGNIVEGKGGRLFRVKADGKPEAVEFKGTQDPVNGLRARRMKGLITLRPLARKVLRLNVEGASDGELAAAQNELGDAYDKFTAEFGRIRDNANKSVLHGDPDMPLLMALEEDYVEDFITHNPKTGKAYAKPQKIGRAKKAKIFSQRTVNATEPPTKADNAQDALMISLNEMGAINWQRMAALTGRSTDVARSSTDVARNVTTLQAELVGSGRVFPTPDGAWQMADEYLSGDVREKLAQAREAAKLDPRFQLNVAALEEVQPVDLTPGQIAAALGSPWIPEDDVADFFGHVFGQDVKVRFLPQMGQWKAEGNSYYLRHNSAVNVQRGTNRVSAYDLLDMAMNGQEPKVYDKHTVPDPANPGQMKEIRVLNEAETVAAKQKQAALRAEFEEWLWSDQTRAGRLARAYNDTYNATVRRDYDGSHLSLPGVAADLSPLHAHQKNAIWRAMQGDNLYMAHIVGAGKTRAACGAGMELRRLGVRKKVMHAVPNHLLEQYSGDFMQMYPGANLLAIRKEDMTPERRAHTMARIATGDWDAVIVTHSALEKLPVADATFDEYVQGELTKLEDYLRELRAEKADKASIKEIEKAKKRLKARLDERRSEAAQTKDKTLTFEELGVDQLFVDEAHKFKNLAFTSKRPAMAGLARSDAKRAEDLFIKTHYLQQKNGGGGVAFMSGTPISNTIAEMYTNMRYLQGDRLEQLGIQHFDSFANMFCDTETKVEMKPSGDGYQMRTSFSKWKNVPEMLGIAGEAFDVQMDADKLGLKRPRLKDGKPIVVSAAASDLQKKYIKKLGKRADTLKGKSPREDNMLKIVNEAMQAGTDMRVLAQSLMDGGMKPETVAAHLELPNAKRRQREQVHDAESLLRALDSPASKVNQMLANVVRIHGETTGMTITNADGEAVKADGAQVIFCDLSTPSKRGKGSKDGWNLYEDMRYKLIAQGIPAGEIAFIHDYETDAQKLKLFDAVNSGKVRVLLGSREKMGSGTNIQRVLTTAHNLDIPWRPSDMEQADGRIWRQGNLNEEVAIYRYVTEETFDVYRSQTVKRKADSIRAVMNNELSERSVEDISADNISYAEMQMMATGNPMLIEKVGVDAKLREVSQAHKAYLDRQVRLKQQLGTLPARMKAAEDKVANYARGVEAVKAAKAEIAGAVAKAEAEASQMKEYAAQKKAQAKELAEVAKQDPGREAEAQQTAKDAEEAAQAAKYLAEKAKEEAGFSMVIGGAEVSSRAEAIRALAKIEETMHAAGVVEARQIGTYAGFPVYAEMAEGKTNLGDGKLYPTFRIAMPGVNVVVGDAMNGLARLGGDPVGFTMRFQNALGVPEKKLPEAEQELEAVRAEAAPLEAELAKPFEQAAKFEELTGRAAELQMQIDAMQGGQPAQNLDGLVDEDAAEAPEPEEREDTDGDEEEEEEE